MTKAQYQIYNRLSKKQVNRQHDVQIVEQSNTSVTFHTAFPGLYLTYDSSGNLIGTETNAQRKWSSKALVAPKQAQLSLNGELGSNDYGQTAAYVDDDDVPF